MVRAAAWVLCLWGAAGAGCALHTDPPPADSVVSTPCWTGARATFEGDFRTDLDGERSPSELRGVQAVTGSLAVWNTGLVNLDDLSCLRRVGGDLTIGLNSRLRSLDGLSRLSHAGRIEISENAALDNAAFAGLERATSLSVYGNSQLVTLGPMDAVAELDALEVVGNDALASLALPGLRQVAWLQIHGNPNLRTLAGLDALESITSQLHIISNERLENIESLARVAGEVGDSGVQSGFGVDFGCEVGIRIRSNPMLHSLRGLEGVQYVAGGLCVEDNGRLVDLQGLNAVVSITAGLGVAANASLGTFQGLGALEFIGGNLGIARNDSLRVLDGLERLEVVRGTVRIYDNDNLGTVDALSALQHVGAVEVYDNRLLPGGNGTEGQTTFVLPAN